MKVSTHSDGTGIKKKKKNSKGGREKFDFLSIARKRESEREGGHRNKHSSTNIFLKKSLEKDFFFFFFHRGVTPIDRYTHLNGYTQTPKIENRSFIGVS